MLKVNDENGSIERKYDALIRVTEYTDDNGLYYMRQRYYNPEIKRFVNQDILTGSIGNSQSLNRYSYVQGNPVSYTDPFGLSPLNGLFSGTMLTHTVCELLGWIPGPVGSIANAVDGLVYLLVDKDYKNALYSLGSSVSFGAGKLVAWAGKGSKTALRIQRVCNFVGSGINFAQSAEGTVNMGGMMIDKYIIQGQPVSGTTAMEFLFLGANIFGATKSGAAIATDVRDFGKFAKMAGIPSLKGDNRGVANAKALIDAFKSGSFSVGDAIFMDADDAFLNSISRRADVDPNGYFDVVAHGTSNSIQITYNGQHILVDHRVAARLIQNADGYNGQPIRLLSCNTGSLDNGFAQNLANTLNVDVMAPTNYLCARQDGSYFVSGIRRVGNITVSDGNIGEFRVFTPGGNR